MITWRIRLKTMQGKSHICYVKAKDRAKAREIISIMLQEYQILGIMAIAPNLPESRITNYKTVG